MFLINILTYTASHNSLCRGQGLSPGCCTGNCLVPEGNCYCDSLCHHFNDCCIDVEFSLDSCPPWGKCLTIIDCVFDTLIII